MFTGTFTAFNQLSFYLGRTVSSEGEEQRGHGGRTIKKVRLVKRKEPNWVWDPRGGDLEVNKLDDITAMKAFLADPGIAWLKNQCTWSFILF